MLYPVYYIVEPALLQDIAIPATNNILALQVDASNPHDLITAFRTATALDPSHRFCLSITGPIDDKTANDLIAFFFFPNYYKSNEHEIILEHEGLKKFDTIQNALMLCAQAQGFATISLHSLQAGANNHITVQDSKKAEAIKNAYRGLLYSSLNEAEKLFINIENAADIRTIEQALKDEEWLFKQQQEASFRLKAKNKELHTRLQEAEQMAQAAAQEIRTQASHIETLRLQSQASFLQNYYNNEYEVLPLWYKRFGHLVKAMMGKRTFRSLFTENEKKYRD